jgi:hypothetical protein
VNGKKFLVVACSLSLSGTGTARADVVSDLQAQMEALQKQLDQVKTQLYEMQQEKKKEAAETKEAPSGSFLRLKPMPERRSSSLVAAKFRCTGTSTFRSTRRPRA